MPSSEITLATDGFLDDVCFNGNDGSLSIGQVTLLGISQNVFFQGFGVDLDAGEVIVLSSDAGTYANMTPQPILSATNIGTLYMAENFSNPVGPAPDGLIVDIPGSTAINGFPAFANVSLPDVAPIEFSVDLESGIISWTNSRATPGAFITVDMNV